MDCSIPSLSVPHHHLKLAQVHVHCISDAIILVCVCVLVAQLCPTLCDPMDCSPPGSSVHGILQARILEWVAISFSRGSSWLRDWTQVSCIAGRFFTIWAVGKSLIIGYCKDTNNLLPYYNNNSSYCMLSTAMYRFYIISFNPLWNSMNKLCSFHYVTLTPVNCVLRETRRRLVLVIMIMMKGILTLNT